MDITRPLQALIPGAQGQILAVLAETTAELNLRTIARLAGVSPAQASRVLPRLVTLGLVERREVPPSSLFRLNRDHVTAQPLLTLARAREHTLEHMGRIAKGLPVPPAAVIVFGSLARGDADRSADIDTVLVRPHGTADDRWSDSVDRWTEAVARLTGNDVDLLEVNVDVVAHKLTHSEGVWSDIRRDGVVVYGVDFANLQTVHG